MFIGPTQAVLWFCEGNLGLVAPAVDVIWALARTKVGIDMTLNNYTKTGHCQRLPCPVANL